MRSARNNPIQRVPSTSMATLAFCSGNSPRSQDFGHLHCFGIELHQGPSLECKTAARCIRIAGLSGDQNLAVGCPAQIIRQKIDFHRIFFYIPIPAGKSHKFLESMITQRIHRFTDLQSSVVRHRNSIPSLESILKLDPPLRSHESIVALENLPAAARSRMCSGLPRVRRRRQNRRRKGAP